MEDGWEISSTGEVRVGWKSPVYGESPFHTARLLHYDRSVSGMGESKVNVLSSPPHDC